MQTKRISVLLAMAMTMLLLTTACTEPAEPAVNPETVAVAKPDLAQIRSDIQNVENEWAKALNSRNLDALMAMYADDAVALPDDAPVITGKEAIRKRQEAEFASAPAGLTYAFETTEVFSEGMQVLEFGKTTTKDSSGNVTGTGKYMALFEKRGDKYVCIREMYNDDQKPK